MQVLSTTGLADSDPDDEFESSSPDTILGHKSSYSKLQLTHFRRESRRGRAAVDPGSTSTVPHRPPQWGSVGACRGFRGSVRGAVLNRRLGRKQPPFDGGLTRPAKPHPALGRASASLLGGVLGGGHNHEHRVYQTRRTERTKLGRFSAIQD